jgi:ribose transport system substrate-binding protein
MHWSTTRSQARTGLRRALPIAALAAALTGIPVAAQELEAAPAGLPATVEEEIQFAGRTEDASFCGDTPMTLAIHDGFGINAWSAASYAAVRSEAAKCDNVTQRAIQGNFDPVRANEQVDSLVAQGIDALTIIPDAGGPAQLPSLQNATAAGVVVVPWGSNPYGEAPADYLTYVDWDTVDAGRTWARWMAETLGGEGKIVFLGGPLGVAVGMEQLEGINEVLADYPNIELLTGTDTYAPTNWDPAMALETANSLLGQFPQIDGVISNYGSDADALVRAFVAAGRPLVPLATLESNGLACDFEGLKATNPDYELATISARNWLGRIAARKAISAVQGIENTEPSLIGLPITEDTVNGPPPVCTPLDEVGRDYFVSNQITREELDTYGAATE